jgi:DNA-binding transcriptional LysR family regulator
MLDELGHFLLVVRHGTLTAAARHAHLTQPALTASIQRLEAQMGARLFVRGPGGAELTAAGAALVPSAGAALAAVADGKRAVAEVCGLATGHVRLGAGATVCTYHLPPMLAEFRERHPGVSILVREAMTDDVESAVARGDLDLGIITRPGGEPWQADELVLVTSPKGPYRPGRVDPDTAPFVTFPVGATTRELLDRHFPRARVVMELGGIAAVKGNVRAGVGLALVSRRAIERDLASGQLAIVPHPETPIVRRFSIVHRGRERTPPAAAALLELLLAKERPRREAKRRR